jgi:histone H3/H4
MKECDMTVEAMNALDDYVIKFDDILYELSNECCLKRGGKLIEKEDVVKASDFVFEKIKD